MLGLEEEVPKPARMSFWPLVDLCAIGLYFALFSSKFIVAPGINLVLPEVAAAPVSIAAESEVVTISEVNGQEMVFYRDSVLNLESLSREMGKESIKPGVTLLVKADSRVSMRSISSLIETAISAGYAKVQLATEEVRVAEPIFRDR